MNEEKQIKNSIITLFMVAIGLIFAILLIVSYSGILVNQDKSCGFNYYGNVTRQTFELSEYTLNQPNEEILQHFKIIDEDNLKYEFCFSVNHTGNGATLEIVNLNKTLTTVYIDSSKKNYCVYLNKEDLTKNNYLGLNCVDCSDNNNVTVYKQTLGPEVSIINKIGSYSNGCEWINNQTEFIYKYGNNFSGYHWDYTGTEPEFNPATLNDPSTVFLFHINETIREPVYICENYENNTVLSATQGETLDYDLTGFKSCKWYIGLFSKWLYISLGLIALMLLLFVGFRNLKQKFFDW